MLNLLENLIKQAKEQGADSADALLGEAVSLRVARRLGEAEALERSEDFDLGLRVFVGRKQAIVSSTDRDPKTLKMLVERAVSMARAVPDDPFAGIADPDEIAKNWPELDLFDVSEPSAEQLIAGADAAEAAAMAVAGVTNSDGAEFSWGRDTGYYVASNGFAGSYSSSGAGLSVSVIAGEGTGMERDYDYSSACHLSDLDAPEKIGKSAGERTVKMLHSRKMATGKFPVIFDPRVSGGLVGLLAGATSGSAIARGTSFIKDRMGQQIFGEGITIIDDPFRKRGPRSRPFDGEGVAPRRREIIKDGILQGWILDLRSARQLKMKTTGNASRGTGGPPSPKVSNFYMMAGTKTPQDLIAEAGTGFYVTSLMGSGTNLVTGDYSHGARGFWIERGQIAFPVSEMTIAGNLKDMWMQLTAANDLKFRYGIDAPTIRIDGMMVAGS